MDLTVLVLTHNRRRLLREALAAAVALPERPHVLVVDNASPDGSSDMVRSEFPQVEVVRLDRNYAAVGRTIGAAHASTRYVAFCDDDCAWLPGSIARAAAIMDEHPRVALVNARVLVHGERDDALCRIMAESEVPRRSRAPGRALIGFIAGSSVVRRDAYLSTGGFDPHFHVGGEEALVALDLLSQGWELLYAPDVLMHHRPVDVSRDRPEARRRRIVRNDLWTAWLRRPLRVAVRKTLAVIGQARGDAVARAALRDALTGLPWIARERRPIGPHVEAMVRAAG